MYRKTNFRYPKTVLKFQFLISNMCEICIFIHKVVYSAVHSIGFVHTSIERGMDHFVCWK